MLQSGGNLMSALTHQPPLKTLLSLFYLPKTLPLTQRLHAQIIINGLQNSILFGSKLTNAYIESGSLQFASTAFTQITHKNLYSWNTILSGYSKQNRSFDVIRLYKQMTNEINGTDSFNLVFVIKACVELSLLQNGKSTHCLVIKLGFEGDQFVVPRIINLYTELGCLEDARKVFDVCSERNLVIWSAMMKGCLKFSEGLKVFKLFYQMRRCGVVELDKSLLETLVRACGNVLAGKEAKACHAFYIKQNFVDSVISLQTSLVDAYMKCGFLHSSVKLFEQMPEKDVVLWTAMVAGFAKLGRSSEALGLFRQMFGDPITPNSITFASVFLACSQIGSLQQGKSVHGYMLRNGVELDLVNYTSLIDMYSKCGSILTAERVFNQMPRKNVYNWSAMINGFGVHGLYSKAIALFDQMRSENQKPNSVTFVSVLSACSHSGRVEEGWNYFNLMTREYEITPTEEHFACMVDLLGRAGRIDEAIPLIEHMPMEPGASTWGSLLSACRIHKRIELAEYVAKKLLPLETDKSSVYVLLLNIYADTGMWDRVRKMRLTFGEKGLHKTAGVSSIEVDEKLYVFTSTNRQTYWSTQIERVWTSLTEQMMEFGHVHDTTSGLHDVDDDVIAVSYF